MGLVYRNGKPYYYKTVRSGGKSLCTYRGAGDTAVMLHRRDSHSRELARRERQVWKDRVRQVEAFKQPWEQHSEQLDSFVSLVMTAAGYHRLGRHSWRRRRQPMPPNPTPRSVVAVEVTRDEYRAVAQRAQAGDESAVPQLRAILDARPDFLERLIEVGGIARHAESAVFESLYGKNHLVREANQRRLVELTAELAGPSPTPIERLLAHRAALSWFVVNGFEAMFAGNRDAMPLQQADFYQRWIDRAHRRFLSAVKALADVRRVNLTAIQVNVSAVNLNSKDPS